MDEKKELISRINDLYKLCEKHASAKFSHFLNENEIVIIKDNAINQNGFNVRFFGGYSDFERCMFGIFPEWQEPETEAFPIIVLKFEKSYKKELTHRDYLGTILSLGIDRGKIGDILVYEEGAYAFVSEDIADYLIFNIKKVANCGINIKKTDVNEDILPKRSFEEMNVIVASARLDAILAAALNISRKNAMIYINSGKVRVNHRSVLNVSYVLKENDLISITGFGRVILESFGNNTRSGRMHIVLKKYAG